MITASATAESSPGAVERMITADGLDWHVVEMGQGPAIVLVHGTAASVHSWRHVMPVLAQTNYVVAMDLPGHAGTKARSSRDYSLERMGRGVSALVDALKITPSIVAGHSAGAAILVWACAHKLLQPSSLVSFNGAFYPFGGIAGTLFSPIAKLVAINPLMPRLLTGVASRSTVSKLLRDTGSQLGEESIDQYFDLFKKPDHVAAALGMMAAWDLRGMDDCLARLNAEGLFVAGGQDKSVPPDTANRAAARCKNAKALSIAAYGHLLHEENPLLAADLIRGVGR